MISPTKLAPIAFFCFNRADKTKQVLDALAQNDFASQSEIFVFCDGPRNIRDLPKLKEVHQVIDKISGFKKVHVVKREINHGVKNSIVSGINEVLENHQNIIIVEDDILCAKSFLRFINECLDFYENDQKVWCITGFNYPKKILTFPQNYHEDIFFVRGRSSSWGWGTWKNRWQKTDFDISDFDKFISSKENIKNFNKSGSSLTEMLCQQKTGKIDTWDIQISYAMFKNNGYTLHPIKTLVKNIGFDASATHTISDLDLVNFEFEDFTNFKLKKFSEITQNHLAEKTYTDFHQNPFFLVKWLKSKKRRRNFKWFLLGVLLAEITNYLLRFL